jgi:hypothetical protein
MVRYSATLPSGESLAVLLYGLMSDNPLSYVAFPVANRAAISYPKVA